jgi:transposase-like protein
MQMESHRRCRPTTEERTALLAAYHRSQLTQAEFAAEQGIGLSTLHRWLHRSRSDKPAPVTADRFIEVPNPMSANRSAAAYRLEFPRGLALEVAAGFEVAELQSLVQLIETL